MSYPQEKNYALQRFSVPRYWQVTRSWLVTVPKLPDLYEVHIERSLSLFTEEKINKL